MKPEGQPGLFRICFEETAAGLAIVTVDGRFLRVNQALADMLLTSPDELVGKRFNDVSHTDDHDKGTDAMARLLVGESPVQFEQRYLASDGTVVSAELRVVLVNDERGQPAFFVATMRDTAPQRRALAATETIEHQHHQLGEQSGIGVGVYDLEGRLRYCNKCAASYMGAPVESCLGKSVYDLYDRRLAARILERLRAAAGTDDVHSYEDLVTLPGGDQLWFSSTYTRLLDAAGSVDGVQIISSDITASKRSEEEARTLARIPAEDPSPLLRVHADGTLLYANPASAPLLDAWSLSPGGTAPPELRQCVAQALLVHGSTSFQLEVADREFAFVTASHAEDCYVNCYGREITAQVRPERALLEEKSFAETLIRTARAIILVLDRRGAIVTFNPHLESLSGYSLAEVKGKDWFQTFLPERRQPATRDIFSRAISHSPTRGNIDALLTRDGRELQIEWYDSKLQDSDGNMVGLLCVGHDVSERVRALRELASSEERFRLVFDKASDGILVSDAATHRLLDGNPAMCAMLGYSAEELGKLTVSDLHPREALPEIEAALSRRIAGRSEFVEALPMKRKDGSTFLADISATTVRRGDSLVLLALFRDVTAQRRMQARAAQDDRVSSMGMLAAGIAHEINNPLTYALYHLESMEAALPDLARLGDTATPVRQALAGCQQIQEVVKGLGVFARVEDDTRLPVRLESAIDLALAITANEIRFRARLVKEYGNVPTVLANEGRLTQVFVNLLINAAHAIDAAGAEDNEIRVRTWKEAEMVYAEVADTGCGIEAGQVDKLFEAFFTTKEGGRGSGLGLAISRDILTGYGGSIDVESERGKGSRFTVRLPAHSAFAEARAPAPTSANEPPVCGRVLIVDDEAPVRGAIARMLREHECVHASSAVEAQRILETDNAFDVILCDMMMPGISGMELHDWLTRTHSSLAPNLVFLTGGAFTPRARAYLEKIDTPMIEKPFDVAELRQTVNRRVSSRRKRH